eukprot:Rhum_TRINITY_DN15315_c7_g2::Rhum_TRINITY_DN15315_c7_g2_i1::g.150761::m.150761
MCHAECATDPLPYEVSPDATAAQMLHDVCALFGRVEKDTALEVDGVEVCVSGGGEDVSVGSVGLHADSRVVVKRSRERVLALVASKVLSCYHVTKDNWGLPEWVWDDVIVMIAIVKKHAYSLQYASSEMRNTHSVVVEAVKRAGGAFKYASAEMRDTREIVMEVVKQSGLAFEYASDAMKNTPEIVMAAVR